jgi:hypothetical protein
MPQSVNIFSKALIIFSTNFENSDNLFYKMSLVKIGSLS